MQNRRQFLGSAAAAAAVTMASRSFAADAPTWQIGCYTRPWATSDYRVALDAIAAAGFHYVGFMTTNTKNHLIVSATSTHDEAVAAGAEAKQRGLAVISLWGGAFALDNTDGLKRLIDNTVACGCPHLLLGGTSEKQQDAYFKIVAQCCDYAADKGVVMSIKPHGGINASGGACRKLVDSIGHKSFRVWFDPGNVFYYSQGALDPVDDAATVDGVVSGMCVKDFQPPKDVMVTPGTGKVDFAKVLARLGKGGFRGGPLVVECLNPGEPAQVAAEAVKARQFLEKLVG